MWYYCFRHHPIFIQKTDFREWKFIWRKKSDNPVQVCSTELVSTELVLVNKSSFLWSVSCTNLMFKLFVKYSYCSLFHTGRKEYAVSKISLISSIWKCNNQYSYVRPPHWLVSYLLDQLNTVIFVTLRESPYVFQRGLTLPRTKHDSAHTCTCKYGHKHTILRPTIANVAFAFNTRDLVVYIWDIARELIFAFEIQAKNQIFDRFQEEGLK